MSIRKYLFVLPVAVALVLAGCSDDDDYQAAAPLKAGNEQVYFAASNTAKSIFGSDDTKREVSYSVVRNTTAGELTVPVTLSNTTPGIIADDKVTFADGDSTATIRVELPDTAKAGDQYTYTLSLSGDNTDPYSLLPGGLSFTGTAVVAKSARLLCQIYYSDGATSTASWYEKAYDLGEGIYQLYDFGNSGHTIFLKVDAKNGTTTPYVEDETDIDQYTDDHGTEIGLGYFLYPWGKNSSKGAVGYVYLLSNDYNGYSGYDASTKLGWFYLSQWMLSTDANPDYWATFNFEIQE